MLIIETITREGQVKKQRHELCMINSYVFYEVHIQWRIGERGR